VVQARTQVVGDQLVVSVVPQLANSGDGGGGGGATSCGSNNAGTGGSAGGKCVGILSGTNIQASYAYAIGAAGSGGAAGTNGTAGGAGGAGYIRLIFKWS
jgi:hypothetical protein